MTPLINNLSEEITFEIMNAESLGTLRQMEDERFDLIITSPPYNVAKVQQMSRKASFQFNGDKRGHPSSIPFGH